MDMDWMVDGWRMIGNSDYDVSEGKTIGLGVDWYGDCDG
jgi:hypothetical protein